MSESVTPASPARGPTPAKASPLRTTLLAVAAIALYFLWTRPAAPPVGWGESFEAALTEAKSTNRPLLIELHSEGCAPCLLMERQVLPDARVQAAVRDFVPVRVDAFQHVELMQRYEIPGTPAFVIADANGDSVSQILGSRTIDGFLEFLRQGISDPRSRAGDLPPPSTPQTEPRSDPQP